MFSSSTEMLLVSSECFNSVSCYLWLWTVMTLHMVPIADIKLITIAHSAIACLQYFFRNQSGLFVLFGGVVVVLEDVGQGEGADF